MNKYEEFLNLMADSVILFIANEATDQEHVQHLAEAQSEALRGTEYHDEFLATVASRAFIHIADAAKAVVGE